MLYLNNADVADSIFFKLLNFLPQFGLVFVLSVYLYEYLEFALFSITFMFVTFNKVCTSQVTSPFFFFFRIISNKMTLPFVIIFRFKYFVWYLTFVPLLVPRLKIGWAQALSYFLLWMFGQVSS